MNHQPRQQHKAKKNDGFRDIHIHKLPDLFPADNERYNNKNIIQITNSRGKLQKIYPQIIKKN